MTKVRTSRGLAVRGTIGRSFAVVVAAAAVIAVAGATASGAAASKVLLTNLKTGEAALHGEPAEIAINIFFENVGGCAGVDKGAAIGKNPSGTAKVSGSNNDLAEKFCENQEEEVTSGGLVLKSVAISNSGSVKVLLTSTIESEQGCKYEIKKLTAALGAGAGAFEAFFEGTAKIQKHTGSPEACAKATEFDGDLAVAPAGTYFQPGGFIELSEVYGVSFI